MVIREHLSDPQPDGQDQPRRRDPEATRQAILDAAEALFLEHGVADTPTSHIARLASVTKSLIHHHFGSKEALWEEIKRRRFAGYFDAQRALLEAGPGSVELLRASMVAFFRFLQSDPAAVRFMTWRAIEEDRLLLDQEAELYKLGIRRMEEAQAAGELRADIAPIAIVKSFLALCLHWFQTRRMTLTLFDDDVDPAAIDEQYLDGVLRILFEGVLPR
jgi:TetR/AcrR family transcriptional regulator